MATCIVDLQYHVELDRMVAIEHPLANPTGACGSSLEACGGLDRERLEASQVDILRWLIFLHQYGLAPLKP